MGHKDLKAALLARRLGTAPVEIDGVGTITVRGLNRDESIMVGEESDTKMRDRVMLSLGCVDPTFTVDEVAAWQSAGPGGEIEDVSRKIAELSKLLPAAAKESYKSLPE